MHLSCPIFKTLVNTTVFQWENRNPTQPELTISNQPFLTKQLLQSNHSESFYPNSILFKPVRHQPAKTDQFNIFGSPPSFYSNLSVPKNLFILVFVL